MKINLWAFWKTSIRKKIYSWTFTFSDSVSNWHWNISDSVSWSWWEHSMSPWPIKYSCTLWEGVGGKYQVFCFYFHSHWKILKTNVVHNVPLQIILSMIHPLRWSSLHTFILTSTSLGKFEKNCSVYILGILWD